MSDLLLCSVISRWDTGKSTGGSGSKVSAGEFGDYILAAEIPTAKIFFHCTLLPGVLKGEDEYLVIGGAYEVTLSTL